MKPSAGPIQHLLDAPAAGRCIIQVISMLLLLALMGGYAQGVAVTERNPADHGYGVIPADTPDPFPRLLQRQEYRAIAAGPFLIDTPLFRSWPQGSPLNTATEDVRTAPAVPQAVPNQAARNGSALFPQNASVSLPPAKEPAVAQKGSLALTSDPPGALVLINGTYTGKITPWTITDLPAGDHLVRMELDNFHPYEETVQVSGATSRSVLLSSPNPALRNRGRCTDPLATTGSHSGGLRLDTIPRIEPQQGVVTALPQVRVYIDTHYLAESLPFLAPGLKEGAHTVRIVDDTEGTEFTYPLWVYPDAVTNLVIDRNIIPYPAVVRVNDSAVKGVPFTVNGRYPVYRAPASPSLRLTDLSGSFVTLLVNGSYRSLPLVPDADHILVPGAAPASLHAVLVTSEPRGAEIFLDGFRTGFHTPFLIQNVSGGSHRIAVSRNGFHPADRIIHLDAGPSPNPRVEDFRLADYPFGTVLVDSSPAGQKILINGMESGETTPHIFYGMPIGSCTIAIRGSTTTVFDDFIVLPDQENVCRAS